MVLVCEDGGHAGVVELDVFVVDFDEVDCWVGLYEWFEGVGDYLRDGALDGVSVYSYIS